MNPMTELFILHIISEGEQKKFFYTTLFKQALNLKIARAIPAEDIKKALYDYRVQNNTKGSNNFGYYLAGLLEGDGHISLPALGVTTLNRVLNPRIVFTSHINNLSSTTPQKVLSMFLLKLKFHVFFRLYGHISKYNPATCKDIALLSLKEISSYNIIPIYQNSIFISIFLSGG